jgi:hypothetical protein
MKRFEKNNKFWEIVYVLDINEILIRTGDSCKNDNKSTIKIMSGLNGTAINKKIKNLIKDKKGHGWVLKKSTITQNKLVDMRFSMYDYDGTLKKNKTLKIKENIKSLKKSKKKCSKDKVLNPKSNRCVLKRGAIGKKLK